MSDRNQQDNSKDPFKLDPSGAGNPAPDYATRPDMYRNPPEVHTVTLSADDAAALDALLEQGSSATPSFEATVDPTRVERMEQWLGALATHRVEQPPIDLMNRTLEAVSNDPIKLGDVDVRPAPAATRSHTFSRRLVEYAAMAIAASVLLMVLIPGIGQARDTAKRVACADNLRVVGNAFDSYATANAGRLPSLASPPGESWRPRDPGAATPTEHSNTANLLPLLRENYLQPERLACPATGATAPAGWTASAHDVPDTLRGYSYVNMYGEFKPRWDRKEATVILADRNPIFSPTRCKSIYANSNNHAGKGSMVLYSDSSARWQMTPTSPTGDNIWTIAAKLTADPAEYTFTETPDDRGDVFLVP